MKSTIVFLWQFLLLLHKLPADLPLRSSDIPEVVHNYPILHINKVSTGIRVVQAAAVAVMVATSVHHKCLPTLARRGDPEQ
jgi:hypothetical protein